MPIVPVGIGNEQSMSIGKIGDNNILFKRKFRWLMTLSESTESNIPGTQESQGSTPQKMWYCKVSKRPTLTFEDTAINFLHEKHHLSGKPSWEDFSMTIYDVQVKNGGSQGSDEILLSWLNRVWSFTGGDYMAHEWMAMGDIDDEYKQDMTLYLLDGHGNSLETWYIIGAWPKQTNFGDLDMASSDTVDIQVTCAFDRAKYARGSGENATGQRLF